MSNATETIISAIKNRRSVFPKDYSDEVIAREVIEEILECANWAPTHRFTEPWRFSVFTGKGLEQLAQFQANLYKQVSTEEGTFKEATFDKLLKKPLMASHVISIGMHRDPEHRVPEVEEVAAVACAVQNMYLAAHAHGLGCYWGSGGITYLPEANDFFGLGPEGKLLGFFFLGVPDMDREPRSVRKPIADKVRWVE